MKHGAPRHSLAEVKRLIRESCVIITRTAVEDAKHIGFYRADILDTTLALEQRDFYKSMTSHRDHRLWMDVYRPKTSAGQVYLKLMIEGNAVIISFKEL
jgi:motility quorum-sensing regulator/GCU-specific mRNA interferase toxin